ncbi:hypothetical protein AVEN_96388-1 [Araneus ventricosus]|uniref:Uncharacterized protein n=1 Tax=Araneus ventricosus TaxID=182803 RepID=A0A4Y2LTV5_ARAVE|nr:hypothetical protein AVEN_96388-1 [Araneus ventricosus]
MRAGALSPTEGSHILLKSSDLRRIYLMRSRGDELFLHLLRVVVCLCILSQWRRQKALSFSYRGKPHSALKQRLETDLPHRRLGLMNSFASFEGRLSLHLNPAVGWRQWVLSFSYRENHILPSVTT